MWGRRCLGGYCPSRGTRTTTGEHHSRSAPQGLARGRPDVHLEGLHCAEGPGKTVTAKGTAFALIHEMQCVWTRFTADVYVFEKVRKSGVCSNV